MAKWCKIFITYYLKNRLKWDETGNIILTYEVLIGAIDTLIDLDRRPPINLLTSIFDKWKPGHVDSLLTHNHTDAYMKYQN